MAIRIKLKEIAEAKGISQKQLSIKAEVNIKTVQRIMRNPYSVVTVETLARCAKVLAVDVSELIESVPDFQVLKEETL